ncbi:GntR family transcriptional regulator [Leifsonia sp. H3M29-4]|uniref:GntR family transcriptional regulator n=1 Tax=Salinibacterium metalliresistens TaxID=3031321 RepID=UPI0023DA0EB6|nr:GntR family transcriptional regulator [Salinibacterium metalliresistens]MDF1480012.1 GntR family transcriptional regulator [Salinibacterium metalliresistens]
MARPNSLAESWTAEPVGRIAAPLREQVITALRQAILDFKLKPGQRLVERELIEQLGVSRTTIREALRELTSEGLVTVVPQKGAVVATPTLDDAIDLYEVRAALESLVVQRFVERASNAQVERLRAAVERFHDATIRTADIRQILAAKDLFYDVLIEGAASAALQQLLEGIQARVQVLRATSLSEDGRTFAAVRELRAVVDAIEARDARLAARLTTEHIRAASKTALLHMRSGE